MILAGLSDFIVGDLTEWVKDVIDALGYVGVAFLVALENVFPPIPSEVVLPAAGLWASDQGGLGEVIGMIIAATAGSLAGALVLYGFAAWIGPERLRHGVVRWGRWFGVKEADLDKAEGWFEDRSEMAVLICRCVPLVRSLISIPAGFVRMNLARFVLFTTLGSLVWNSALILLGFYGSEYIETVASAIEKVQYLVLLAIVVAVGWFLWRRVVRPRMHGGPDSDDGSPDATPAEADQL